MNVVSGRCESRSNPCPICGTKATAEPRQVAGEAVCPDCRPLLQWFRDYIAERMGVARDQVTADADFVEDLHSDSIDVVELILQLEEEFQVSIPDEEAAALKTVGDAIRYVQARGGSPPVCDQCRAAAE